MIVEIRDEVVTLSGALRRNHWQTLESAVKVRLRHHPTGIVVDCRGLTFLTPEGAETFRDAARHCEQEGARFVLAEVPPAILHVLRETPDVASRVPTANSLQEARESIGLRPPLPRQSRFRMAETDTNVTTEILVALLGEAEDGNSVRLAAQLAARTGGRLHLVYLLLVPRDMPLNSVMKTQEVSARETLHEWGTAIRQMGRPVVQLTERTRNPATRLVEIATRINADTLVLTLTATGQTTEADEEMVQTLMQKAPCRVLISYLPVEGR